MQVGRPSLPPTIALCENLDQFFRETLVSVRARHAFPGSPAAELYLASLLSAHAHESAPPGVAERPLTSLLEGSLDRASPERLDELRRIGDGVLYTTGFFGEQLARRGHSVETLQGFGAQAYRSAGKILARSGDTGGLFDELASHFSAFARLLHEVADTLSASALCSHRALLDVYERWLRTGSDCLAEALVDCGVLPTRGTRVVV